MSALTIGRIVHFKMVGSGHVRPAIVVKVYPGGDFVNLQVFTDLQDDGTQIGTLWTSRVPESRAHEPWKEGSWRWPERIVS